jgi:hypothetical protein
MARGGHTPASRLLRSEAFPIRPKTQWVEFVLSRMIGSGIGPPLFYLGEEFKEDFFAHDWALRTRDGRESPYSKTKSFPPAVFLVGIVP